MNDVFELIVPAFRMASGRVTWVSLRRTDWIGPFMYPACTRRAIPRSAAIASGGRVAPAVWLVGRRDARRRGADRCRRPAVLDARVARGQHDADAQGPRSHGDETEEAQHERG